MRVLVTRPKDDTAALQQELHQRGVTVTLDPMLEIRRMACKVCSLRPAMVSVPSRR
jgi:uroporphyrinogen-III synthase